MPLLIPADFSNLPPAVAQAFDDLTAALQTWAGKAESYGRWIDVPYTTGLFWANSNRWTVSANDFITYRYTLLSENVMVVQISLRGTNISVAPPDELYVRMPPGFHISPLAGVLGIALWSDVAGRPLGVVDYSEAGGTNDTRFRIIRDLEAATSGGSTDWPGGVADVWMRINAIIPVFR